jgi:hypothetical protein
MGQNVEENVKSEKYHQSVPSSVFHVVLESHRRPSGRAAPRSAPPQSDTDYEIFRRSEAEAKEKTVCVFFARTSRFLPFSS